VSVNEAPEMGIKYDNTNLLRKSLANTYYAELLKENFVKISQDNKDKILDNY
jgi:hypothetical protein